MYNAKVNLLTNLAIYNWHKVCRNQYLRFDELSDDVSGMDVHSDESCDYVPMDFG